VFVITRRSERAATLAAAGFYPIVADVTRPASLAGLPKVSRVLYAVGYDRGAGKSRHEVYVAGLRQVLDSLPDSVGTIIYISSTSVYGDWGGDWVNEQSPCRPRTDGGRVCLEAEQLLSQHAAGRKAIVLRLAGIYGPGRLPHRQALLTGGPVMAEPNTYLNLIHVSDAVNVVLAAENLAPPRLYVVADGQPVLRGEYYACAAALLRAPLPRFAPPADAECAQRRGGDNRRVDNRRLVTELDVRFAYPSYREGLAAALQDEPRP
jgi:nucleoside-diphosphate-sugar epimerase